MASVMRFDQWQDSNGVPVLNGTGLAIASSALPIGTILQVVRASDTTTRTTTSTVEGDVGFDVTITPQRDDSQLLILATGYYSTGARGRILLTDSNDTRLSWAEGTEFNTQGSFFLLGHVISGTTSARTYKLRFFRISGTTSVSLVGAETTSQLFAMEVAA